ncbi:MAG TPA: hypothetical protein VH142_08550 [Polyangiaceae bacterium]|nr:hypothetical protein [Polyangiaceae bacterium]
MRSRSVMGFEYLAKSPGVCLAAALALGGCGGAAVNTESGPSKAGEVTHRDTRVLHADCPIDGPNVEKINAGGDARPDIFIVRSGGHEVCRAVDLNYDGAIDTWIYRDAAGNVTRRENDYDRDGHIDEIAIYQGGVLVEKERATTLVGRLDTWHFYQGGKLARTERDSDGDAQIDQWWEYPKPDQPDCPLIHSDVDGDGHPDPGATVDVCSESSDYTPPERPSDKAPSGADFDNNDQGGVPTELENKSLPGGAATPAPAPATPATAPSDGVKK